MTQEAFEAWWYSEGSQAPYTHHDCEEHTKRMCQIAWLNGAYKERESCAVLAKKTVCDTHTPTGVKIYGTAVAKAIRARGEQA